jgi:hypothetical protein
MTQTLSKLDDAARDKIEAAVYRRLRDHLMARTDVQNIDLMNLSGFCRNCLSRWWQEAAEDHGVTVTKDQGREIVYGEPYDDWRDKHQTEAGADQQATFDKNRPAH